jgi:NAD-dependent deacetylase
MFSNTLVVAGAGISVESGIQPFRGKDGIWEENPLEMATYRKFIKEPDSFLEWYYKRFKSCLGAKPNETHQILADKNIRVITQNIDGLHRQANHNYENLIEIHGCIYEKRPINATSRSQIIPTNWEKVDENALRKSLYNLFQIPLNGRVDAKKSYRPHVLLFDEVYNDLYLMEEALQWVLDADAIIFMGTSNSVGITSGILEIALRKGKQLLVVDPNPDKSFLNLGIEIYQEGATTFCKKYFKNR